MEARLDLGSYNDFKLALRTGDFLLQPLKVYDWAALETELMTFARVSRKLKPHFSAVDGRRLVRDIDALETTQLFSIPHRMS